jgi:hypothetical protein
VAAGGELVVDCLIAGAAEGGTFLASAQQTGEVAPGDQLGRPRLADAERFTALYWIARVLTDRPAAGSVVVTLGDSITRGDGTTPDLDRRSGCALARRAAQRGVQPVLGTITPFGGSSIDAFPADNEDVRLAVNNAITGQAEWPVADFAAALADPGDRSRLAAAFDSGDGVHPGDAGARALAAAVDLAVFK